MSTNPASSPQPETGTSLPDLLGRFLLIFNADIILRSSDFYDFPVQKHCVVDSSPVLGERILAVTRNGTGPEGKPRSTSGLPTRSIQIIANTGLIGSENSLPVVQLSDSHSIISSLLTFVFPVLPVLPPTIEQILELLSVAQKYEMTAALIRIRDCASRRDPPFICPEAAFRVYSLARQYGLLQETLEAAKETLKSEMTIEVLVDELDIRPSVALYEPWKYRQKVLNNLDVIFNSEFFDMEVYQILRVDDESPKMEMESAADIPPWLKDYLDSVVADRARVDLTAFHLALSSHLANLKSYDDGCEHGCPSISGEMIHEFWAEMTAAVQKSTKCVGLLPRM